MSVSGYMSVSLSVSFTVSLLHLVAFFERLHDVVIGADRYLRRHRRPSSIVVGVVCVYDAPQDLGEPPPHYDAHTASAGELCHGLVSP